MRNLRWAGLLTWARRSLSAVTGGFYSRPHKSEPFPPGSLAMRANGKPDAAFHGKKAPVSGAASVFRSVRGSERDLLDARRDADAGLALHGDRL